MKEKQKLIKDINNMIGWIMNNPILKSDLAELLEKIISDDSSISVIMNNNKISEVNVINLEHKKLNINISEDCNEIEISYTQDNYSINRSIRRNHEEIQVEETETCTSKEFGTTTTFKKMKYLKNMLVKSTFAKTFESIPKLKSSYSLYEQLYIFPSGKTFVKREIKAQENSPYKSMTEYFETNSSQNISFESTTELSSNFENYSISETRYNIYSMRHLVSLLPVRCVNIGYIDGENICEDSIVLFSADDEFIEFIDNEDFKKLTYDKIIYISYGGEIIYHNNEEKYKNMIFKKDE